MNFLIQGTKNNSTPDFVNTLISAIDYHRWMYGDKCEMNWSAGDIEYFSKDNIEGVVPIGTVEFVTSFIKKFYNKTIAPLNIPEELVPYAKRKVITDKVYKKRMDVIKHESNGLVPEVHQYSEYIEDLVAEWRAFVFNGELLDVRQYSGILGAWVDLDYVKELMKAYKNCAPAYTLDVGISHSRGSMIIEAHDFFSCGLYGFQHYDKLPFMFSQTFYYFVRGKK